MNAIYLVNGSPHRLCDCSPYKGDCPKGVKRTLATADLSRCLIPAPDVMMALTPPSESVAPNHPHPAPNAAEPMVPTGEYREITLTAGVVNRTVCTAEASGMYPFNSVETAPRYVDGFCQDREKCLEQKKDALRYRFWRRHWTAEDEGDFDKLNDILGKADVNTPDQVDAALDAAIKEAE